MLLGRGPTPRVKICGITRWADARLAVEAGADALGFNFYRPSPRYIEPRAAARIARRLHRKVTKVGVFVNESPEVVRRTVDAVGLDAVQLHGAERPSRVGEMAAYRPVIKVFRVRPGFLLSRLARYPAATAFLLDGYVPGRPGGTGRHFDWELGRRAARYGRVILAGGLRPDNVAEAIARARPFAVDVCSGVESQPGKKDPAKLREFMRQVKRSRRSGK
ncbi:MAG TPA: phosphoribosylanthranilate isomerase [Candidatus Dormibacteraeota bacterium]|nr:phosphoribosylanthranilate isomerase [Candidatus Dormibacteraeota bacterium]